MAAREATNAGWELDARLTAAAATRFSAIAGELAASVAADSAAELQRLRGARGSMGREFAGLIRRLLYLQSFGKRFLPQAVAELRSTTGVMEPAGILTKKGGVRKNWLKRWFAIEPGTCTLAYYKDESKAEKKGEIQLLEATEPNRSRRPGAEAHEIEIQAPDRTWLLQPPDPAAATGWLNALRPYAFGRAAVEAEVLATKQAITATVR